MSIVGLLLAVLGGVAGAGAVWGIYQEKIRNLERARDAQAGELAEMRNRLARGDTQFAVFTKVMEGVQSNLAGIEEKLDGLAVMLSGVKRRRRDDDEDDEKH